MPMTAILPSRDDRALTRAAIRVSTIAGIGNGVES
jgi:hypothetical protein